jgi:hypothetical protein
MCCHIIRTNPGAVGGEGPGNEVEVPGMRCERHCGQVQARFESLMRWL